MHTKSSINNIILRVIVPLFSILLLILFPKTNSEINNLVENVFYSVRGESEADTNIVIIEITSEDILKLRGWPLKRSYYALLIDNLSKLNANKIGLEVFLSENIHTQDIYNTVLINSITKSKRVVLSSILKNISETGYGWNAEEIILPLFKKRNDKIFTGHINFIESEGIIIPTHVNSNENSEYSFSSILANTKNNGDQKVNFKNSWKLYKSYSLLQFFDLIGSKNNNLKSISGKTILIGVTDPLIAKTVSSFFDSEIPGVGLHAIALDNLLNKNGINYSYVTLSKYIFLILSFILSLLYFNKPKVLIVLFFLSLATFFVLFIFLFIQLNYIAILFPIITSIIFKAVIIFADRNKELIISQAQSDELRSSLILKEKKLDKLKKEFINNKQSEILSDKIAELQTEIIKLKDAEKEDNELYDQSSETKIFEGIVYRSNKMQEIVNLIKKVAPQNASILIQGESGSGKELVANAIHNLSLRKFQKLVTVNCAALPENLLESELFGHVKGAFTDASRDKIGRFEEADKGSLFLDEIGETSENFQVKLLRILQSGDFQKVGSSKTQNVDVRLIAATNKNLKELVKKGEFREDLFYRLNVITIEIPTLNERKEDIEILVKYFAEKEAGGMNISRAVMKNLVENSWQGNIRELESTIKRAVIFASSEGRNMLKLQDLPSELSKIDKNDLENMILESLREKEFSHASINETAKELGGINRTVVSENFRGIFFKNYVESNFDVDLCVKNISNSNSTEIIEKLTSKLNQYLKNIENDLKEHKNKSLDEIKVILKSKYKNLPQKFHRHLDQIILRSLN